MQWAIYITCQNEIETYASDQSYGLNKIGCEILAISYVFGPILKRLDVF